MDRKIFNRVYAKFSKKDYFGNKMFIRNEIEGLKQSKRPLPSLKDIKGYLKIQKEKCFALMVKRINEFKEGEKYPLREKFTWACVKASGLI
jgi:hypothetical protein